MALFVMVTEECEADAKRHGLVDDVDRLRRSVEGTQSLSSFDQFPPPYYVKKKLMGRQPRLIAEIRHAGEHSVLVFLAIMTRGGHDYEAFQSDAVTYGNNHFQGMVSEEEVQAYVVERTHEDDAPSKVEASPAEYEFLYSALSHANGGDAGQGRAQSDAVVCESHSWVDQVAREDIRIQLNRLGDACREALGQTDGLHKIAVTSKPGWHVWAFRQATHLFLVSVCTGTGVADVEEQARALAQKVTEGGAEAILQCSSRAYPALILWDEELWIRLEREAEANMALSPEETEVLTSARSLTSPFPLFINGRAGSGKSTILQYLFADLLFAFLNKYSGEHTAAEGGRLHGLPLYLTANGELLRNARGFVDRLLTSEAKYRLVDDQPALPTDRGDREALDAAFQEFHPFMLALVPQEHRDKFRRPGRIDYPRFRRMWEDRFGKDPQARRDFGADVSWHVIRSYIKGMGSDGFLGPEDYVQLPENQLTVDERTFGLVYARVWESWYAGTGDDGQWDDQDLARFILDQDLVPRTHSAVFCDEAQDFTRIELEVLLRLSLYSCRSLGSDAVRRVPFAFAGDEFQTLNPTGFRWDAAKAAFVEKFIFELDPARRGEKADLNYHELRFNYRSTRPIVCFSNLVQAVRAARFGINELRPQRPWMPDDRGIPVLYFPSDDGEFWAAFDEVSADYVVIVPCLEGEETDYVQRDPVLSQRIRLDGGVPRNVLSSSRAKGCEYNAVVVYGFGEAAPEDLISQIGASRADAGSVRHSLASQYFINRTYVAVSRAKRRLLVVDTPAGVERLWKPAINEHARERVVHVLRRGDEIWLESVGSMNRGRPADLGMERVPDRSENARLFESDGHANRDEYLMQQAANAYRELGEQAKWRECRAWALDFDGKAFEAGDAFAQAGLLGEARRCLWRAERSGWLKLMELAGQHPDLVNQLEVRWARAIKNPDVKVALEVLQEFGRRLERDAAFAQASLGDAVWNLAIDRLVEPLTARTHSVLPGVWQGFVEILDKLGEAGIRAPARLMADLCFNAGLFERAASYWEQVGERRSARYHLAKAKSSTYPESLEHWSRLPEGANEILAAYESARGTTLAREHAAIVGRALLDAGRYSEALDGVGPTLAPGAAIVVAIAARKAGQEAVARMALRRAVILACTQGDWPRVLQVIQDGQPCVADEVREKPIRTWIAEQEADLRTLVVRALARSEALPRAGQQVESQISKYLRDTLRVKGGTWIGSITLHEAGAAHERTGRLTDSIQFYEAALGTVDRLSGDDIARLQTRWLAVKYRQLEYERNRAVVDTKVVSRIEDEIRSRQSNWRLPLAAEPERFPLLEPIDEHALAQVPGGKAGATLGKSPLAAAVSSALGKGAGAPTLSSVAPMALQVEASRPEPPAAPNAAKGTVPVAADSTPSDTEVTVGPVRIQILRSRRLIRVEHSKTLDVVMLDGESGSMRGTAPVVAEEPGRAWRVPEWGARIGFDAPARRATLSLEDLGLQVQFDL